MSTIPSPATFNAQDAGPSTPVAPMSSQAQVFRSMAVATTRCPAALQTEMEGTTLRSRIARRSVFAEGSSVGRAIPRIQTRTAFISMHQHLDPFPFQAPFSTRPTVDSSTKDLSVWFGAAEYSCQIQTLFQTLLWICLPTTQRQDGGSDQIFRIRNYCFAALAGRVCFAQPNLIVALRRPTLDASGGSAFLNFLGAAEGALILAPPGHLAL